MRRRYVISSGAIGMRGCSARQETSASPASERIRKKPMNAGTSDLVSETGGISARLAITAISIAGAPIAQNDGLPPLRITQSKAESNTRNAISDGLLFIFKRLVFISPDPGLFLRIDGRLLSLPSLFLEASTIRTERLNAAQGGRIRSDARHTVRKRAGVFNSIPSWNRQTA